MASIEEDLDFNPFYQSLQTKYSHLFIKAQQKCYLVCIPQTSSLINIHINHEFIENHILKPSPYFQDQYFTTDTHHSRVVHLEDNCIKTGKGFKGQCTRKIVYEELAYNKEFQQYKILVIDKPIGLDTLSDKTIQHDPTTDLLTVKITHEENARFLQSFPAYRQILADLSGAIQKFNTNYMVLKEYLGDAAKTLKSLYKQYNQQCLEVIQPTLKGESRFCDTVGVAIESHILHGTNNKLFPVICERFCLEDNRLTDKLLSVQHVTSEQLGVRYEFSCSLPAAVVELANLDNHTTPLEKMNCFKTTLDLINEGVNSNLKDLFVSKFGDDMPCVTSDDLIPIMVVVIIQAKCRHIISNIYYIENFHWSEISHGDISYSLVTFKAAAEYLKHTDFSKLKPPKNIHKKEVSLDELQSATQRINLNNENASGLSAEPESRTRYDRHLDKISKMLEMTTNEFAAASSSYPASSSSARSSSTAVPTQQNSQSGLGDFLSSLQSDVMPSKYGKLT